MEIASKTTNVAIAYKTTNIVYMFLIPNFELQLYLRCFDKAHSSFRLKLMDYSLLGGIYKLWPNI